MNDVVKFSGAGLPAKDVGLWRQKLAEAKELASVAGSPFLRLGKSDGEWVYGQDDMEVQPGSSWAINPTSLSMGYVCWKGGKKAGERMASILGTPISQADLPNVGAEWDEQVSFDLVCLNGDDKGTQVTYNANSYGGRKAFSAVLTALQRQIDTDPTKPVPVVELKSDSYPHAEWGKVFNPIFEITSWSSMEAETPAATAPAEVPKTDAPARRASVDAGETAKSNVTDAVDLNANADAAIKETAASAPAAETVTPRRQRQRRAAVS